MNALLLALLLPLAPAGAAGTETVAPEGDLAAELRDGIAQARELRREMEALMDELRPALAVLEEPDPYPAALDIQVARDRHNASVEGLDRPWQRVIVDYDRFVSLRQRLDRLQKVVAFTGGGASFTADMGELERFERSARTFLVRVRTGWERDIARYKAELGRRESHVRRLRWALAAGALAILALGWFGWRRYRASRVVLPGYRIERRARSAEGLVMYEATDLNLNRRVAVKEVSPQEAESAAALKHPDLGKIYAVLREAGRVFLVFELPKGKTLAEVLASPAKPEA